MRHLTKILTVFLALITVVGLLTACSNTVGGVTFVSTGDRDNAGAIAGKTFEE